MIIYFRMNNCSFQLLPLWLRNKRFAFTSRAACVKGGSPSLDISCALHCCHTVTEHAVEHEEILHHPHTTVCCAVKNKSLVCSHINPSLKPTDQGFAGCCKRLCVCAMWFAGAFHHCVACGWDYFPEEQSDRLLAARPTPQTVLD